MTERNFTELQVGEWYLDRRGTPIQIVQKNKSRKDYPYSSKIQVVYSPTGRTGPDMEYDMDLIIHVEIVPKKQKRMVPKGRVVWCIDGKTYLSIGNYTEKEYKQRLPKPDAFVCILTDVPEFPVTMVEEEE